MVTYQSSVSDELKKGKAKKKAKKYEKQILGHAEFHVVFLLLVSLLWSSNSIHNCDILNKALSLRCAKIENIMKTLFLIFAKSSSNFIVTLVKLSHPKDLKRCLKLSYLHVCYLARLTHPLVYLLLLLECNSTRP